ncbi:MAG: hypothetical protein ACI88H_004025 [Cocleimonas sp.]|jgi:hypothetical protein
MSGKYTKEIIKELLSSGSSRNSLKLIIVYTGDSNLSDISGEINQYLSENGINGFAISSSDSCCVFSNSCKILVRAKSNGGQSRNTHNPGLADKEVTYEELPAFITSEFTKMTNGLLSNFALQSLTAIRQNFHQILNVFNKKLDAAYLTHQSLLSNSDDANELLVELLGDTFTSILRSNNLNSTLDNRVTNFWLESNISDEEKIIFNNGGTPTSITYTRSKDLLRELLQSEQSVDEKFIRVLSSSQIPAKSASNNYKKYAFSMFHNEGEHESLNKDFARLCQYKNLIHYDDLTPTLSLGTIVKSTKESNQYFICIQQRCDSTRVYGDENRRFLFLSLTIVDGDKKFDFLTPEGQKLRLDRSTYDIRTVKFPGSEIGAVKAVKEEESNLQFFEPLHYSEEISDTESTPEKFEFIFELKDLYAQRVVANYSANLARVGVDEPELIRLS